MLSVLLLAKMVTLLLRSTDVQDAIISEEATATLVKALVKKTATAEAISSVDPIIVHHTCLTGGWARSNLSKLLQSYNQYRFASLYHLFKVSEIFYHLSKVSHCRLLYKQVL